mgnify:FL=1
MDNLVNLIDARASMTGFLPHKKAHTRFAQVKHAVGYWESDYASLLLWDVSYVPQNDLIRVMNYGEQVLDTLTRERETKGYVIDASLIYAFRDPSLCPSALVGRIERDTHLARKHVVIRVDGHWTRTERITVLGLSPVSTEIHASDGARFTDATERLIMDITHSSPSGLARRHANEWENGDV